MAAHRIILPSAFCLVLTGCASINWSFLEPKKADTESGKVHGTLAHPASSLAYRDTVAQYAWIEGMRKMQVRGYGVVVGLGDRGSGQCPRQIRDLLIQELAKQPEFQSSGPGELTPQQLIDSPGSAVVQVQGEIPAAATRGTRFDLYVQALPGTQTQSLNGGRLWPCSLRVYRDMAEDTSIPGKVLATGQGPLFRNPFADEADAATKRNVRNAVVISGGITREDRRVRLMLAQPSYRQSGAIAQRINARFTGEKIAAAESPSYIALRVPAAYRADPGHFLALVRHLYVPNHSGFLEQRCRDLAKEIVGPDTLYEDIALAWEGIGRPVTPTIRDLYGHAQKSVSFFSARTGVRLGDDLAAETLIRHASDADGGFRLEAIEELGRAGAVGGPYRPLRRLLDDPDPRIRVAAYEALHRARDELIAARRIGEDNFVLEQVPTSSENLIYATRSGDRRIAVLGTDVKCEPPLFYNDPGEQFLLSAEETDATLTVFRKAPRLGIVSPPIPVHYDLGALVSLLGNAPEKNERGEVRGLGIDYCTLVQALHELCRLRAVNAKFMLESPTTIEMFGPLTPTGRPEYEETSEESNEPRPSEPRPSEPRPSEPRP